jgi:uroporphyrin-III C-methyltransferase
VPPEADELKALVGLQATIVILMGITNLDQIMAGLSRAGLPPGTPAAVIERGFSDHQRSTITTAAELAATARRLEVSSPAVVVIGEVVALAPAETASAEVVEAFPPWFTAPEVRAS